MFEKTKELLDSMTTDELTECLIANGFEFKDVNKFKHFTDDELYILKRQAIESSWEICGCGAYSDYEVNLHNRLMNEIADEVERRGC